MGLISDYRKYKKQRELLTFLEKDFGVTKGDLEYLHEALDIVKNKKNIVLDEKVKEANEEKYSEKMTPEKLVASFAKDVEEFYPYGRPKD